MRLLAILPVALSAAALILSFLCLFAGSKKGFMEDYAVVTLNASQIGQSLFDDADSSSSSSSDSDNPLSSFIHNVTSSIEDEIEDTLTSFAKDLGLHDFYSAHLLDFCEGYYVPGPVPNATLESSDISQNVTSCSNRTAMYTFDPKEVLQKELNKSGVDVNLDELNWPEDINDGLQALEAASNATFVLYCIAIALVAIAFLTALAAIFLEGRLWSFVNIMMDWLAFLMIGIASAIATAFGVKTSEVINKYGNDIGVSASKGSKFLVLTWVATGVMLVASIVWCFDCIQGRRRYRGPSRSYAGDKLR